ncbi:MAG TPA: hypothetical protein VKU41_27950 [Polyangiaceae bacterium]|nr:hypothetical protein [Polyangiaceae bacterium]
MSVRRQLSDEKWARVKACLECTSNLPKQARRFATRYEKTLRHYAAVVAIGYAMLWLRIGAAPQG